MTATTLKCGGGNGSDSAALYSSISNGNSDAGGAGCLDAGMVISIVAAIATALYCASWTTNTPIRAGQSDPAHQSIHAPKESATMPDATSARAVNIHREDCDTYIGRPRRSAMPSHRPGEIQELRDAVLQGEASMTQMDRLAALTGFWGNPWRVGKTPDPIGKYRLYIKARVAAGHIKPEHIRRDLTGKRLGCFCKPKECHGDFLA